MNDKERTNRNLVFALALVVIAILIGLMLLPFVLRRKLSAPVRQFVGHGTNYFVQVARACDSIILQHPLGTNWVKIIPTSDAKIPQIIKDLHPSHIDVESDPTRVALSLGNGGESGFGLAWENRGTNYWILYTSFRNSENIVYSETKH
jgi:hypothetical protein